MNTCGGNLTLTYFISFCELHRREMTASQLEHCAVVEKIWKQQKKKNKKTQTKKEKKNETKEDEEDGKEKYAYKNRIKIKTQNPRLNQPLAYLYLIYVSSAWLHFNQTGYATIGIQDA